MLPDAWYFDPVAFWILSALTLWEGVQRVPAGAWVLRHAAGYPWQVAQPPREAEGRRLVSWGSPLVCHLVLTPGLGEGRMPPRRLGLWTGLVRIPALLALVALVVGVPVLTPTMGFLGLLIAVGAALAASLLAALLATVGLWRMGIPFRSAARAALPILSPFAAPRAPELVLARALRGVAFADAVRALLPADGYAEWARPVAYDLSHGLALGDVPAAALLPAGDAQAILRVPPPGSALGDAYCGRCGRVYLPHAVACRACESVDLVTVDEDALRMELPPVRVAAAPVADPAPAVSVPTETPATSGIDGTSATSGAGRRKGKSRKAPRRASPESA